MYLQGAVKYLKMRLWHSTLIPVLPRQQLVAQLRECVAIAKSIFETGKPNHVLVNKIMDFSLDHFRSYCNLIIDEMKFRGFKVSDLTIKKLEKYISYGNICEIKNPFSNGWFTDRYLNQCLYNLQEKYDCKAISENEWQKIRNSFLI